jgi:hypothetical protein
MHLRSERGECIARQPSRHASFTAVPDVLIINICDPTDS